MSKRKRSRRLCALANKNSKRIKERCPKKASVLKKAALFIVCFFTERILEVIFDELLRDFVVKLINFLLNKYK